MKIAIYYESRLGRNDGPPLYWCTALKDLGHEVTHFSSVMEPDKAWGKFDFHIWVDWGEDALTGLLPFKPINMKNLHPSVYITSDTHLGYDYRFKKSLEFDHVYCNQLRAMSEFNLDGINSYLNIVKFLPHAVEPRAYPCIPVAMRKYDIGFVGFISFDKRVKMLDRMFKEFSNFWYGQRLFEEAAEVYRKSRIVFNTAAVDDINMRVFEVMATGSFLLTEFVPTLEEVFEDGKHLVTYKTMDEAVEKAHYYLKHEDEREKIALAGMKECLEKHTYQERAKTVLKEIFKGET